MKEPAKSESNGIVANGGWDVSTRLAKRRAEFFWILCVVWFLGWLVALLILGVEFRLSLDGSGSGLFLLAVCGQAILLIVAILFSIFEKRRAVTVFREPKPDPEDSPYTLH